MMCPIIGTIKSLLIIKHRALFAAKLNLFNFAGTNNRNEATFLGALVKQLWGRNSDLHISITKLAKKSSENAI